MTKEGYYPRRKNAHVNVKRFQTKRKGARSQKPVVKKNKIRAPNAQRLKSHLKKVLPKKNHLKKVLPKRNHREVRRRANLLNPKPNALRRKVHPKRNHREVRRRASLLNASVNAQRLRENLKRRVLQKRNHR